MNKTVVVIPYSPRSWDGICSDAVQKWGKGITIVPLVLVGDESPSPVRVLVDRAGAVIADGGLLSPAVFGRPRVVCVANGGRTPQTVGLIALASRAAVTNEVTIADLQPDGCTIMHGSTVHPYTA